MSLQAARPPLSKSRCIHSRFDPSLLHESDDKSLASCETNEAALSQSSPDQYYDNDKKAKAELPATSPLASHSTFPVYHYHKFISDMPKGESISSAGASSSGSSSSSKSIIDKLKKVGESKKSPEEKQQRKEDYERLKLRDRTVYGETSMRIQ